jgi:hypothetical protein
LKKREEKASWRTRKKAVGMSQNVKTLVKTHGVLFLPKGLWSLIRLTSFPNTCFSTRLVMSPVVQLVSIHVLTLRFKIAAWN